MTGRCKCYVSATTLSSELPLTPTAIIGILAVMIPKVIHFCWFGGKPYSPLVEECMATWEEKLPEYQIKRWDESNSPIEQCRFVRRAFKEKRWAFVSDYVRFHALYNEGGIYLDTDMFVLKSLNPLLHHDCFLGLERRDVVGCSIVGAERHHAFIHEQLKYYESFDSKWLMPKLTRLIVSIIAARILSAKGMKPENVAQEVLGVQIYPSEYFYSYPPHPFGAPHLQEEYTAFATPNSYAVHLWNSSWFSASMYLRAGLYKEGFPKVWKEFCENPFQPPKFYGRVVEHGVRYICQKLFQTSKRES